jgi:hypothetical protein
MKSVFYGISVSFAILLTACGGGKYVMDVTPDLLAAQGSLRVKSSDNGNSRLRLELKHLAQPEKVSPNASAFVAWAVPQNSPGVSAQNVGTFRVNSELEGSLETVTPHKEFELFITAEPKGDVGVPTGRKLLWTNVRP